MNPFEIRLNLLHLAKAIVQTNATKSVPVGGQLGVMYAPPSCNYTVEDVLKVADRLNAFVGKESERKPKIRA